MITFVNDNLCAFDVNIKQSETKLSFVASFLSPLLPLLTLPSPVYKLFLLS